MRWLGVGVAILVLGVVGCRGEAVDDQPDQLVREFIIRMKRVHGNPRAGRQAFELLSQRAQRNLTERAARASALAGRKVAPEEMIAPSRFSLLFDPKRISASVKGDWATVTVYGSVPARERREVSCVKEQGRWRVVLNLPPLPPIQKRRTPEEQN